MRQFLEALGLDLQALGMEKTPHRVAQAFADFFSGLKENPDDEWQDPIATQTDGLVVVRNIRFHSMCEHHLLPFFGSVHVAYYPKKGTIAGFGHFVRAVDILARRPQLQERMTDELCQSIRADRRPGDPSVPDHARPPGHRLEYRDDGVVRLPERRDRRL